MFNITSLYLPYILHAVSLAVILLFKDTLKTGQQPSAPAGADLAKYELWSLACVCWQIMSLAGSLISG